MYRVAGVQNQIQTGHFRDAKSPDSIFSNCGRTPEYLLENTRVPAIRYQSTCCRTQEYLLENTGVPAGTYQTTCWRTPETWRLMLALQELEQFYSRKTRIVHLVCYYLRKFISSQFCYPFQCHICIPKTNCQVRDNNKS